MRKYEKAEKECEFAILTEKNYLFRITLGKEASSSTSLCSC